MAVKVAIDRNLRGRYLRESPASAARGLESTLHLADAKQDFADQAAVDAFVTARGGVTADWLVHPVP